MQRDKKGKGKATTSASKSGPSHSNSPQAPRTRSQAALLPSSPLTPAPSGNSKDSTTPDKHPSAPWLGKPAKGRKAKQVTFKPQTPLQTTRVSMARAKQILNTPNEDENNPGEDENKPNEDENSSEAELASNQDNPLVGHINDFSFQEAQDDWRPYRTYQTAYRTYQTEELREESKDPDYSPARDRDDDEVSLSTRLRRRNHEGDQDDMSPIRGQDRSSDDLGQTPGGYTRASSLPAVPVTPVPERRRRRASSQRGSPINFGSDLADALSSLRDIQPNASDAAPTRKDQGSKEVVPMRHEQGTQRNQSRANDRPLPNRGAQSTQSAERSSNESNLDRQRIQHPRPASNHNVQSIRSRAPRRSPSPPAQRSYNESNSNRQRTRQPHPASNRNAQSTQPGAPRRSPSPPARRSSNKSNLDRQRTQPHPGSNRNAQTARSGAARRSHNELNPSRQRAQSTQSRAPHRSPSPTARRSYNESNSSRYNESTSNRQRDQSTQSGAPRPLSPPARRSYNESNSNRQRAQQHHPASNRDVRSIQSGTSRSPSLVDRNDGDGRAVVRRRPRSPVSDEERDIHESRGQKRRRLPNNAALSQARRIQGDEAESYEASLDAEDIQNKQLVRRTGNDKSDDQKKAEPWHLRYYNSVAGCPLKDARLRFQVRVMTENAYPEGRELEQMQETCWDEAAERYPEELAASKIELTAGVRKLLVHSGNEIRGKVHTIASGLVVLRYQLVPTRVHEGSKAFTEGVVRELIAKDNFTRGFYLAPKGKELQDIVFCNPCIRDVILGLFFKSKPDVIVVRALKSIPGPLIAIVCAGIRCALDEWQSGEHKKREFSQKAYREQYVHFRAVWKLLEQRSPRRAERIATDIADYCFTMSGFSRRAAKGIVEETEDVLEGLTEFGLDYSLGGDDEDDEDDED